MDRSTPINSTNESLHEISDITPCIRSYLEYLTDSLHVDPWKAYGRFLINYHGSPAFLSEKIAASSESVLFSYETMLFNQEESWREEMNIWVLGASYDNILGIHAKQDAKCESFSCYEQSSKSGKICKPGMFCFYMF